MNTYLPKINVPTVDLYVRCNKCHDRGRNKNLLRERSWSIPDRGWERKASWRYRNRTARLCLWILCILSLSSRWSASLFRLSRNYPTEISVSGMEYFVRWSKNTFYESASRTTEVAKFHKLSANSTPFCYFSFSSQNSTLLRKLPTVNDNERWPTNVWSDNTFNAKVLSGLCNTKFLWITAAISKAEFER